LAAYQLWSIGRVPLNLIAWRPFPVMLAWLGLSALEAYLGLALIMTNIVSFKDAAQNRAAEPGATVRRVSVTAADLRVGVWLVCVAILVFAMVIVGGATRLTDSGLSITEWKPIHGAIPPLNSAQWAEEFALYRAIPEYQLQNRGMSLSEFQFIYWWEWAHRFLGRIIGLAFLVPLIVFVVTRQVRKGLAPWLWAMFALGGLQGAIGWWMVSSGLSGDRLDVAAYRLATHLSMAFALFALLSWTALDHLAPRRAGSGDRALVPLAVGFLVVLFCQIILGAFVAGTDAGLINNDWPTFAGGLFPANYGELQPFVRNLVENTATIQFNHRIGAYCVAALVIWVWFKTRRSPDEAVRRAGHVVLVLTVAQVVLGIVTLTGFAHWTPPAFEGVMLGIAHQGLGALLFCSAVLLVRSVLPANANAG
jgi:heme a synthase